MEYHHRIHSLSAGDPTLHQLSSSAETRRRVIKTVLFCCFFCTRELTEEALVNIMSAISSLQPLPSPPASDRDNTSSPKSSVEELASLINSTYKTSDIQFFVNGRPVTVKNPNPDWVLLDWIRSQDNLKGTKLGCGEGGCGACTVVLQAAEPDRKVRHLAINACLYPLVGVDGKSLITIEGIGTVTRPHPLQERIAEMQYVTLSCHL